ncbi:MAG: response regulator [Salegentibacter mishustinae]|nr:response regulator [Salegentibacter mishustinae]
MKNIIKVLMVDDHPLIVEGYKNILLELDRPDAKIIFESADNLRQAYEKIGQSVSSGNIFDVIFLDVNLPEYPAKKIFSGEDLALYIRKVSKGSKIIFLTMLSENFRLYNLVKNVNPEGLLVKSDVGSKDLKIAFQEVLQNKISYSNTVLRLMQKQVTNDFALDQFDRQILYQLSLGIQTKKLPEVIPLSLAAIEKRKRHLKDLFGLDKEGDLILLQKAKQMGFL